MGKVNILWFPENIFSSVCEEYDMHMEGVQVDCMQGSSGTTLVQKDHLIIWININT